MNKIFDFVAKHAGIVVFIILLLTAFFAFHAASIRINASFSAFMPWGESTDYYEGGVSGQLPRLGTEKAERESLSLVDRDTGKTVVLEKADYPILPASTDCAYILTEQVAAEERVIRFWQDRAPQLHVIKSSGRHADCLKKTALLCWLGDVLNWYEK